MIYLSLQPLEILTTITSSVKWMEGDLLKLWHVFWWISETINSNLYLEILFESISFSPNSLSILLYLKAHMTFLINIRISKHQDAIKHCLGSI